MAAEFMDAPEVAPGDRFRSYARPRDEAVELPFRVHFRTLHAQARSSGHWVQRHRHPHYELLVPVSGRYACRLDGLEARARPGQAVLVRPGGWHEDCCPGAVSFFALTMAAWPGPTAECSADILAGPADPRLQVVDDRDGRLLALCRRIADEAGRGGPVAAMLLDALAAEAMAEVLRGLPAAALAPALAAVWNRAGFARQVEALCARHAAAPLPVAALAAELGLSERAFSARCRAELGGSPARLLLAHRLRHARDLLRHTSLPVAQVAQGLGFASPFHFSRVYKRAFAVSPAQDRAPE